MHYLCTNECVLFFLSLQSDGIEQTKMLATEHTKEAVRLLQRLTSSNIQQALIALTQKLLSRQK